MGDLTEKDSAQPVKIVGADEDGNETNYLNASTDGELLVGFGGHTKDAFGRLRVSNPTNLFEYTHKYDLDFDVYWSTDTESGGTVTYDSDKVSRFLNVTGTVGSKAVMQTRRRMEYYAGKSHLWHWSVNFKGASSGIRKRLGAFDDDNGFFFETDGTDLYVVIRSKVSGSVVDRRIAQTNWNGNKGDGTKDNWTADPTFGTLFWVDFSWLGIGAVRYGVLYQGKFIVLHTETISQEESDPYTQSPHLPFRMEIERTGASAAANHSMSMVCAAYEVEGNPIRLGKTRSWYQGNDAETISGEEVVAMFRINPDNKYSSARFEKVKAIIETGNDEVVFRIYQNPTVTTTPTWDDIPLSIMQTSDDPNSETINTSTGNVVLIDTIRTDGVLELDATDVFLGFDTSDSPDIFVITADSLNGAADLVMNVIFREYY